MKLLARVRQALRLRHYSRRTEQVYVGWTRRFIRFSGMRHPADLGIVLMDLGFAGVFRSTVALLLMPIVFWMFKRRMDVEEAFLAARFGGEYREYMARTARLLPGVY